MAHKWVHNCTPYLIFIEYLYSGIDGGIKMRPNEADLECLGQDFKSRWDSYFAPAPDKPIIWIGILTA